MIKALEAGKLIRCEADRLKRFGSGAVVFACGAIMVPNIGLAQNLTIDNNTAVTAGPGTTTWTDVFVGNASGTVGGVPGGTYIVPLGSDIQFTAPATGPGIWVGFGANSSGLLEVGGSIGGPSPGVSPVANIVVGNAAGSSGVMNVSSTGFVNVANLIVGSAATSVGVVNVNGGTLTSINPQSQYYIGFNGQGTLNVTNGGQVVSLSQTYVGYNPGSVGTLTVDGPGSSYTGATGPQPGVFIVGDQGEGHLIVTNGGSVGNVGLTLQIGGSSVGTGLISGAGSKIFSGTYIGVGVATGSNGTLTITDGAAATGGAGTYIGFNTGSTGKIVVSDAGSLTSPVLVVGTSGTADLQVQPGGTATFSGQAIVGAVAGSGSIEVSGTGTLTVANNNLTVGGGGNGAMTISNGGTVTVTGAGGTFISGQCAGPGLVGVFCGTPAPQGGIGTVTVTDPGSVLNAGTGLTVGQFGPGTLTITNSGQVVAGAVTVAQNAGSTGTLNIGAGAGSAPAAPGTLNAPTATFGAGTGDIVFNHTSGNYVFDPVITGGGATTSFVDVYAGTTVMTGASDYFGLTTIHGGILAAGTTNVFSPNSDYVVQGAGTLDLRGNSQTVLSLANAGLVNMGTGTPPTTVLTTGNYVGQGGTIAMNTFLGTDSSPSDRLVILGGTATGNSFLRFTNAGGPGALTTANGILVVDAVNGATTAAGAFTMANPELRAGAFDYRLFQGGPDGSDPNNWYLRSTFIPTPGPTPGPLPIIGPELATYGVVQPIAQQLGRSMLGTHDERMGALYYQEGVPCEPAQPVYTKAPPLYTKAPPTGCAPEGWRPAVWGRVFGQQIDNHYQAFADPRADGQLAGFQAGIDLFRSDSLISGHKDYGGLYFAYGNANVDVTGLVTNAAATGYVLQHTGGLNLNAYSGGAYWTHYGTPGWYLDVTLQGTSYGGSTSTEFARLNTTGSGFISSLEGGYPIALPQLGPGFVLEPQAQVLWQWVSFDSGFDGLGPVALGTTSETTVRLGLKGKWTITTDSGQVWQPYVRANVWSDFGGSAATMFGPDSVPLVSQAQYMDVDAGFTTRIDAHFSAYADAGYQFAISNDGGGKRNGVKGTAGLRYQW